MKTNPLRLPGARLFLTGALSCAVLTGCVDDNYDLSDIDTTTRVEVNDLTLPVNISEVKLKNIISLDEGSQIQIVNRNGEEFYAFVEKGDFNSDPVEVAKIIAKAPVLTPTEATLELAKNHEVTGAPGRHRAPSKHSKTYEIVNMGNGFRYEVNNVDEAIVEIQRIGVDSEEFTVHLDVKGMADRTEHIYFEDLRIQVPDGLECTPSVGSYDPKTGIWIIPRVDVSGVEYDAWLTVTAMQMAGNGGEVTADHRFIYEGDFKVLDGYLTLDPKLVNGEPMDLPDQLDFRAHYFLGDIAVRTFTGVIDYKIKDLNINPVHITDLPDFLAGDETQIQLENPQIYLQLNNPVADNGLSYQGTISFTALRKQQPSVTFTADGPFKIGHAYGAAGPYNTVLAPDENSLIVPDGFASNLQFVKFSSLGSLLGSSASTQVHGIPETIEVDVLNPEIPRQTVTAFPLGTTLPAVKGRYELMAPLSFKGNSTIVYKDTVDGWNDEDVDAITITRLEVSVDVTNTTPLAAQLVAYPIDRAGNVIAGTEVTAQELPANCQNQPMKIELKGTVEHLDGLIIEARVKTDGFDKPLSPDETITLNNLRAKVSGYYVKEL